jgi:SAM-dependent methyltransferase
VRDAWLPLLRCPCSGDPLELDPIRVPGGEIVEAFLVGRAGRRTWPVIAGIAVLPPDLPAHLRARGAVYWRTPMTDPRMVRFLLGRAGRGMDVVPFDEVVRRYGDLAATDETAQAPAPEDAALARLLAALAPGHGRGLDAGCGVGRGVFVLAAALGAALGVDRSVACIRRARNIAVTREHFFLPAPPTSEEREIPVDLERLHRAGSDFAVASPERLPLGDGCLDVVVLRDGDGAGPYADPAAARAEARRVLSPDGLLLLAGHDEAPGDGWIRRGRDAPFAAWSRA